MMLYIKITKERFIMSDNAKEICDMCIYQETEECIDCITNSLIQQQ